MIKLLYSSHSKKAKTFRKWATNTLFTTQMGTQEQKEKLALNLLGSPSESVRDVLKSSVNAVSCIYLFSFPEHYISQCSIYVGLQ